MARLLTDKQEAFAKHFAEHGDASKAYRECYDVKPSTKPNTIWRAAHAIADNPKVAARIAELRKPAADAVTLTLEEHLRELASIRDMAKNAGQFAAASSAEMSRGKAAGLYVERKRLEGALGITVESVLAEIA